METNMSTTTLGYNKNSSSSSPPQQVHTLIFNNQTQISHNNLHPTITDPDLTVTTTIPPPPPPPPEPPQQQQQEQTKTCYRECLRNHAASMGSHVVDGCGEFMPSGEEGSPQSFVCAACNCHRNFHRKHFQQLHQQHQQQTQNVQNVENVHNVHNFHTPSSSSQRFSHANSQQAIIVPPLMMNFGSGAAESSSEDLNISGGEFSIQNQQKKPALKKRIRTKFSQEQKDKMMEFGEKIGWKIQKHDEHEVQQFCSQVGIKRQVFKVWMHNNKQAMKKQQQQQQQM
ncbi:zinc-finger homeodomain protein 6-like [Trifolium pratense]|uniref:zinc-finger homeodomain protein 6-like n=1 Tax=Trifolium pratense TaxID=57577 RepID=UPI001E694B8C|nr:zinc-finger homeodomain protein 6-like [Trifolium pratense]